MEKMILKNVAASRNSTKNRAQQIVEALKKKRVLEEEAAAAAADAADAPDAAAPDAMDTAEQRALKKRKKQTVALSSSASPPRPSASNVSARTALAAGILSPARPFGPRAAAAAAAPPAAFVSPPRRPTPLRQSPTTLLRASPARTQDAVKPLHLPSPVRPPRSAVQASPARLKSRSGAGIAASPLRRRQELLSSPLRRGAPSPKRPLVFDETTTETGRATRWTGQPPPPPLLCAALDQIEAETAARTMKSVTKQTAKSPFQSFQAKVKQSPAKLATMASSPGSGREQDSQLVRNGAVARRPRAGPTLVDLTHAGDGRLLDGMTTSNALSLQPTVLNATTAGATSGGGAAAAAAAAVGVTPSLSKPMRKFLSSSSCPVVAQRSICFSTEGVATALDVTPDGEIIVVGFMDGSVRLYEMDSSVSSDRHGYLLGHIDEQSAQGASSAHLRVKISSDGRYVFVGCRQGPRVVMSINLNHYRNVKDGDDDDFQQCHKHFHSNGRLRGFADVTTYVPQADAGRNGQEERRNKRSAYYILTGLGVGYLNLWRFVEPEQHQQEPIWEHLQNFSAGGNTATTAAFLPSSISPGMLAIAAVCKDKNIRMWPLEFTRKSTVKSNDDCAAEADDTGFLGGNHAVKSHFNIPNTSDIIAMHGQHAYGISLMGAAYRICFPDSSNLTSSSMDQAPRQEFELEKIGGGGGSTSRRSNIMLESLSASDDGKAIIAVSTEGIFYYSNKLPDVGSCEVAGLRIIGKNASENALFKTPMKVYTPLITTKGKKVQSEAMMAVVTNPSSEDSENEDGYINVDLTEVFAARWMVPSRGNSCWVCGVRNTRHWVGPPESKTREPVRARLSAAEQKEELKVQRRRQRALKRAKDAAERQKTCSPAGDQETPRSAKTKTAPLMSAKKTSVRKHTDARPVASADDGSEAAQSSPSNVRQSGGVDNEDDEEYTGSDDSSPSVASLLSELEHFKKRNAEIKTEWQRRLQGERQLRRKWKQREEEFLDQLNDSLTKLDAAEVEGDRLRVLLRDAEKRFAFEKASAEQENSVKARYEQLCEHMNDKLALVADQKRLLEQTTRSLLAEVDRNVHALKNAVVLEKSECVVCKDQQAVTAVVPCGHLCFCEADAETYRRNCTSEYPTCPICQQEIVSLLRIYT
ncbi:unnamed protein product [Hyaloperonospora brassicae]|uniref:RING-type domain-containing protein n=1 Tax=Hyaloperonospora brassicae TaxID=162125 RepID=A0AAV0TYN5_HYABA|nr:unnamed protein product [Hyaloperonospora brassicae]